MNRLFNLPNDILRHIYEYDPTYKNLLTDILKNELNEKVFDKYYKEQLIDYDGEYINFYIQRTIKSIKRNPNNKIYVSDLSNIVSCSNSRYILTIKGVIFYFSILYKEDYMKLVNKEYITKYKDKYILDYEGWQQDYIEDDDETDNEDDYDPELNY
jgi:hypothetical protein